MTYCRWPKGCDQPVSLLEGEGREIGTCFYHWKQIQAKLDPFVPASKLPPIPGVISDDGLSFGAALLALGASPERVKELLTA